MTPDNIHDDQAVLQFFEKSLEFLKQKGVEVTDIHKFTDHCNNQYKSKRIFHKMRKMKIKIAHHFFAVKHGKGPTDRAGGNFKNLVKRLIKDPKLLTTTCGELAKFYILHYEKHTL